MAEVLKNIFHSAIILFFAGLCQGQITQLNGYFPVNNYTNDDFNSPVQIWTGEQTDQGIFVFGNDKKIISYNGTDWSFVEVDVSKTKTSEKNIEEKKVYKIFRASDSSIYVARENSLGTLEYNEKGALTYVPFHYDSTLLNVWHIHEFENNTIVFTSTDRILSYEPSTGNIEKLLTKDQVNNGFINSSVQFDDKLMLGISFEKELNKPIGQFLIVDFINDGSIQPISVNKDIASYQFRSSYKANDTNYFVSYRGGIFYIDKQNNVLKERFRLKRNGENPDIRTNALIKHDNFLWVATANHGVEIYDLKGKMIREFGEVEGLQDLNVFSLFFDKDNNLWLNLDNGIANIEFSSPTALWDRNQGLEGAAEALVVNDKHILIATRAGIFNSYPASNRTLFKNSRVIDESCFDIKVFHTDFGDKTLIVGYNGIYELTSLNEKAKSIGQDLYGWELHQSPFNKNEIFLGGEGFLGKLILKENGWNYQELKRFEGTTIRKFEHFNETLYFSVSDQGVYSINKEDKINQLNLEDDINPDKSHFYLADYKGTLYAGYTYGLLKVKGDSLVKASAEGIKFKGTEMIIHRLYKHPKKDELWAVIFNETDKDHTKKEIGYFTHKNGELTWKSINNNSLESGVVMDIQYHDDLLYFATTEGLLVFDRQKLAKVNDPWNIYS